MASMWSLVQFTPVQLQPEAGLAAFQFAGLVVNELTKCQAKGRVG